MFSNLSWPHSPFNLAKKNDLGIVHLFFLSLRVFPVCFLCFSIFRNTQQKPTKDTRHTHTSNKVFKNQPPGSKSWMPRIFPGLFSPKKKKHPVPPQKKHDTTPTPNAPPAFRPCKELMQATHLIPHLRFLQNGWRLPRKSPFWDYGGKCEPLIRPGLSGGQCAIDGGVGPLRFPMILVGVWLAPFPRMLQSWSD